MVNSEGKTQIKIKTTRQQKEEHSLGMKRNSSRVVWICHQLANQ